VFTIALALAPVQAGNYFFNLSEGTTPPHKSDCYYEFAKSQKVVTITGVNCNSGPPTKLTVSDNAELKPMLEKSDPNKTPTVPLGSEPTEKYEAFYQAMLKNKNAYPGSACRKEYEFRSQDVKLQGLTIANGKLYKGTEIGAVVAKKMEAKGLQDDTGIKGRAAILYYLYYYLCLNGGKSFKDLDVPKAYVHIQPV
jgi:hypothetical protein